MITINDIGGVERETSPTMARMYTYKSYSGTIQLCVHLQITDNIESKKRRREWNLGKIVMI